MLRSRGTSNAYWKLLQIHKNANNQIRKFVRPDICFVHRGTNICDIVLLDGIFLYSMHDVRKVVNPTTKANVLSTLVRDYR